MSPDRGKLREKIQHLRDCLRRLERIRSKGREAFLADDLAEPAATRLLQVAIESMLDAANHIVAREGWGLPRTYRQAVDLLIENGVLPESEKNSFRAMVSFRNRAVHLYDQISAEEVYSILENDLSDFELFIASVAGRYLAKEASEE